MPTGARATGAEITSIRAPRVTAARRLTKRAFRQADRRFLAEGPQAVREALGEPERAVELFVTAEGVVRHPELLAVAEAAEVPVVRVSGEVMASLAQTVTPQGVVAVCTMPARTLEDVLSAGRPHLVVVLAAARDPGNAGTVIRTADAAGADAVVASDTSVDVYNGKCVRASAGSLFHLPVVPGARLEDAVPALHAAGVQVLAADATGQDLDEVAAAGRLAAPTAWMFGNEAWGLPESVLALADDVVRVPIYGRAESLNLATAAAVCLYASARAQRDTAVSRPAH